jgi:hypothetical protein
MEEKPTYETENSSWAVIETMGHTVLAGKVSKEEMFGLPLLRVDVPPTSKYPRFTRLYGGDALFCITFVSEEVARHTAEQLKADPVSVYAPDLVPADELEAVREQLQDRNSQVFGLEREIRRLKNALPAPGGIPQAGDDIPF